MKNKFTLIELLVVVAIIGILASLLLPTLGKARKKSQQAVCKSQFKQLGTASIMYADDNDDHMPSVSHPDKDSRLGWKIHIGPYLNNSGIDTEDNISPYKCPSRDITTPSINQASGTSYNPYMGDPRFVDDNPSRKNTLKHAAKKINDIDEAVETGVFADSVDGDFDGNNWTDASHLLPSQNAVGYRHNNGLNIAWADGHVAWSTPTAIEVAANGFENYYYYVLSKSEAHE